jgi:hypothetical protein
VSVGNQLGDTWQLKVCLTIERKFALSFCSV